MLFSVEVLGEMRLVCFDVALLVNAATGKEGIVQLICSILEAASCLEGSLQAHRQKLIERWQFLEGKFCPRGRARPADESEAHLRGWHRRFRIFE